LCTLLVGIFDQYAPREVTYPFLYLLPISFVSWFCGKFYGVSIAILCTTFWSLNNIHPDFMVTTWNVLSTFIFFLMIVFLLNKTRELFENEKNLARTDTLTGAKNLRAFTEMVEHEMLRSERERFPSSLAYIDLDNFKSINDTFGHEAGDQLLRSIVNTISLSLRKTDILGRLGGDEFVIFFPEAGQASVEIVMQKIHLKLAMLMENLSYQTSVSVGVVTCEAGIHNLENLISFADNLMYQVKSSGKNNVYYRPFPTADSKDSDPRQIHP
jgi:diguanylate cyclase (GGDEF)-like protein